MGYTRVAIKSASWVSLLRGVFRSSAFIRTAILARLLTPTQFGVFGVAAIVLGFVEMITETGINVFLIQHKRKNLLSKYIDTAWTVSIIRGFLIGILMIITSPLIARFFNSPSSLYLLILIATVPMIRGFINPAIVNFQKQLQFQNDFWFRSTIIITDALVAIITALILRSPISLVLGLMAGSLMEVFLSHRYLQLKPKLAFNKQQFQDIIRFGKWITGAGVMAYFSNKSPDIIIGRTLPKSSLGIYQMAYRFAIIPIEEAVEIINRVSFPIFVQIADDRQRLKKALIKNTYMYAVVALPLSLILFFFADVITRVFLGNQWLEVIPIMQAMSAVTLLFALNSITNPVFLSIKKQNYLTYTTFIRLITILITIIPLSTTYGLIGTVYALALSFITPLPLRAYYLYKIFKST